MKRNDDMNVPGDRPRAHLETLRRLFDEIAPEDRTALEEELRDAGLDPDAVGRRGAHLAREKLKGGTAAVPDFLGRSDASGAAEPSRHASRSPASAWRFRGQRAGWAAVVVASFGIGWLVARMNTNPSKSPDSSPRHESRQPQGLVAEDNQPSRIAGESSGEIDSSQQQRAEDTNPGASESADPDAKNPPPQESIRQAGIVPLEKRSLLGPSTWKKWDGLLPEPVLDRIISGKQVFAVQAIDPDSFRALYSRAFWNSSAANEGRFGIDGSSCGLMELETGSVPAYYFGYPFPKVGAADAQAGCEIMWNVEAATAMGVTQFIKFEASEFGEDRREASGEVQSTAYVGGSVQTPTSEGLRWAAMLRLVYGSASSTAGALVKRFNDWDRPDEAWRYDASTRRVRRISHAFDVPIGRADVFGQDLNCFAAKIESVEWQLVGEGSVLAPLAMPAKTLIRDGDPSSLHQIPYAASYDDVRRFGLSLILSLRPVWIVEARPKDPESSFGNTILYVDKEMYRIYWKVVYSRSGTLLYDSMCSYHWVTSERGDYSAVTPALLVNLDDSTGRGVVVRRSVPSFVTPLVPAERPEPKFLPEYTLKTLTEAPRDRPR